MIFPLCDANRHTHTHSGNPNKKPKMMMMNETNQKDKQITNYIIMHFSEMHIGFGLRATQSGFHLNYEPANYDFSLPNNSVVLMTGFLIAFSVIQRVFAFTRLHSANVRVIKCDPSW